MRSLVKTTADMANDVKLKKNQCVIYTNIICCRNVLYDLYLCELNI